jgi:hypothetical protein
MEALVRAWDWAAVGAALDETPALKDVRDGRGRGWLHIAAMVELAPGRIAAAGLRTADALLDRGFPIDGSAFEEGDFQATPVWHAVAFGRNLPLVEHLLKRGASPEHSLFAAAYNRDLAAIRLLVAHGAKVDGYRPVDTPFLFAVQYSHFEAAEELLKLGADPNAPDAKGYTALHRMLKKGSDPAWVARFMALGAAIDIPGPDGATVREMLRRKRDPGFRALAD